MSSSSTLDSVNSSNSSGIFEYPSSGVILQLNSAANIPVKQQSPPVVSSPSFGTAQIGSEKICHMNDEMKPTDQMEEKMDNIAAELRDKIAEIPLDTKKQMKRDESEDSMEKEKKGKNFKFKIYRNMRREINLDISRNSSITTFCSTTKNIALQRETKFIGAD